MRRCARHVFGPGKLYTSSVTSEAQTFRFALLHFCCKRDLRMAYFDALLRSASKTECTWCASNTVPDPVLGADPVLSAVQS